MTILEEMIRGAKEFIERDEAKLAWYKAHGHYTVEDAGRFERSIREQRDRVKELEGME